MPTRYAHDLWQTIVKAIETIRPVYEKANKAISLGLEIIARRWSYTILEPCQHDIIVDVGAGPGNSTRGIAKHIDPKYIIAVDPSTKLLSTACKEIEARCEKVTAIAENLPLRTNAVCASSTYFASRDFIDPIKGLAEMYRVSNKVSIVVDIFLPENTIHKRLLEVWVCYFVPLIAMLWGVQYVNHYRMLCPTLKNWRSASYVAALFRRLGSKPWVRLVPGGAVGVVAASKS